MHELSICQALINQLRHIATKHDAGRITRVILRYGSLSGLEPHLLRQAFPLVAVGSVAEDAELVMEESLVRVMCQECGMETEALPNKLHCGACGAGRTRVVCGDELLLVKVELIERDYV